MQQYVECVELGKFIATKVRNACVDFLDRHEDAPKASDVHIAMPIQILFLCARKLDPDGDANGDIDANTDMRDIWCHPIVSAEI